MSTKIEVNWEDPVFLQEVLNQSKNRKEALILIGYNCDKCTSHPGRTKLNAAIKKYNLDISSFTKRTGRWDILPSVINDCFSIADVIRAVGLQDGGGNYTTTVRFIKEMGLDTSHFTDKLKGLPKIKIPNSVMFVENSTAARATVRNRIKKEQLVSYECADCGLGPTWNGKELTLQLEHKNGNCKDQRLENLEFLCPNCHTQNPTWGTKSRKT